MQKILFKSIGHHLAYIRFREQFAGQNHKRVNSEGEENNNILACIYKEEPFGIMLPLKVYKVVKKLGFKNRRFGRDFNQFLHKWAFNLQNIGNIVNSEMNRGLVLSLILFNVRNHRLVILFGGNHRVECFSADSLEKLAKFRFFSQSGIASSVQKPVYSRNTFLSLVLY